MRMRNSLNDIQRHYHSIDNIVINPFQKKTTNKQTNNEQKTNGYSHDIIGWPSTLNTFNWFKEEKQKYGRINSL